MLLAAVEAELEGDCSHATENADGINAGDSSAANEKYESLGKDSDQSSASGEGVRSGASPSAAQDRDNSTNSEPQGSAEARSEPAGSSGATQPVQVPPLTGADAPWGLMGIDTHLLVFC